MKTVYIGLGSNLGDKRRNCMAAIHRIDQIPGCKVKRRSALYRTEPVGVNDQDWFVNSVAAANTDISPQDLLDSLLAIEANMGRMRKKKWEARIIDLDILLYGNEVVREKNLFIPHPLMHSRRFVLKPLVELAPGLRHPILGKSMTQLLEICPERGQGVVPIMEE